MKITLIVSILSAMYLRGFCQTHLDHQESSPIINLEGIGKTNNGYLLLLETTIKRKLILFSQNGQRKGMVDLDKKSNIVGHYLSSGDSHVLVYAEDGNEIDLITFTENAPLNSTLLTMHKGEKIFSNFSYGDQIHLLTVTESPNPIIRLYKVDVENKIRSFTFQIDKEIYTNLSMRRSAFIDTEKENATSSFYRLNKIYAREEKLVITIQNEISHLESNLKLIEIDLHDQSVKQRELNSPLKGPHVGSFILDDRIYFSKAERYDFDFEFTIFDYSSLKELKRYHYTGNDSLTLKTSSVYQNGEIIENKWNMKSIRKKMLNSPMLWSVERLDGNRIRILFGGRYFKDVIGAPGAISNFATETYFVAILDDHLLPASGNEFIGSTQDKDNRITLLAKENRLKFTTEFETPTNYYVAALKGSKTIVVYTFEKEVFQHYSPIYR